MTRKRAVGGRFWLGIVISAVFLVLAVRKADWASMLSALASADVFLLCLGALCLVGTFTVFAVRWKMLLGALPGLSVRDTFCYIMIGYVANTVLPLRLGDVARAVMMAKKQRTSVALVFASIALERVLDVLALLGIVLGLSVVMDIPQTIRYSIFLFAAVAVIAMAILFIAAQNEDLLSRFLRYLSAKFPFLSGICGIVEKFAGGLQLLKQGKQSVMALALSTAAWLIAGIGMTLWVKAFGLDVPWYAGVFVLAVINLGSAIPSSPGFIGVYHYLAVLALSVWVPDKSVALAFAVATHGLNLVMNLSLGSLCLWREGLNLSKLGGLSVAGGVSGVPTKQ